MKNLGETFYGRHTALKTSPAAVKSYKIYKGLFTKSTQLLTEVYTYQYVIFLCFRTIMVRC